MSKKHTPGPWVYEYRDGNDPRNKRNGWGTEGLWGADNSLIFGTAMGWEGGFEAPLDPDACLIACAPEMLALLKELVRTMDEDYDYRQRLDEMIAKAEGR